MREPGANADTRSRKPRGRRTTTPQEEQVTGAAGSRRPTTEWCEQSRPPQRARWPVASQRTDPVWAPRKAAALRDASRQPRTPKKEPEISATPLARASSARGRDYF